jgi:hypothetical protein
VVGGPNPGGIRLTAPSAPARNDVDQRDESDDDDGSNGDDGDGGGGEDHAPSLPGDLLVKTYAEAYAHCAVDHQWFVTAISPAIPAA